MAVAVAVEQASPVTAVAEAPVVLGFDELMAASVAFASTFDPARVTPERRGVMAEGATRLQSLWANFAAVTLAEIGKADKFCEGYKDPADALAKRAGVSRGDVDRAMQTGRLLAEQPEVREAAMSGELSARQAAVIAEAVAVNPAAAPELLNEAKDSSLKELTDLCRRKIAAKTDQEERRRRAHARRDVRFYHDQDGDHISHFKNPSEYGEAIEAFFRSLSEPHREKARLSGTFERSGAYLSDGFLDLVRGEQTGPSAAAKSGAKVIVRVDKAALERGAAVGHEICEMRRSGPLAVSAVEDLIESGAFLAVVVAGRDGAIERVAHLGSSKKARALLADAEAFANEVESKAVQVKGACHVARNLNAYEQTALEFLYPDCTVKGCGNDLFLERDHRNDWSRTLVTRFDEIDRLCSFHHDLKTRGNWMLVEGRNKRAMVPPDDPRHPHYKPPPHLTG